MSRLNIIWRVCDGACWSRLEVLELRWYSILFQQNVSCSMEPGVSQVRSPSSVSDFDFETVDSVMEVGDAGGSVPTVDLGDGVTVEGKPEEVGGFEAVAEGFFVQAPSPSLLLLDQDALGVEVQVPEEEAMDNLGVVESLAAQEEAKLVAWPGRPSIGSPTSLFFTTCRVS